MLKKFKKHYQAEVNNMAAAEGIIKEYKEKIPSLLIDIWKTTGFGKYNKVL